MVKYTQSIDGNKLSSRIEQQQLLTEHLDFSQVIQCIVLLLVYMCKIG